MSMIGSSKLHEVVNEKNINNPSDVLKELDKQVVQALKQKGGESRDGMDIAFVELSRNGKLLRFSGANRPLYIIRNGELTELPGNKLPIGGYVEGEKQFGHHRFDLLHGDCIYAFSDGYCDQFGGEKGKKLMTKHFKSLLLSIWSLPMKEQMDRLAEGLNRWKGGYEQVDDILVIGIRV